MQARLNYPKLSPELYQQHLDWYTKIKHSGLDKLLIELVLIRVSQINHCAFCLDMHTKDALKVGENPKRIYLLSAWRESSLYSDKERAALEWAESLTLLSETQAPDATYEAVKPHFSEKELVDLTWLIGGINTWNRMGVGFPRATAEGLGMISIGILGYSGRMGQLIAEEIAASDTCKLSGGLVRDIKSEFKKPEGVLITSLADELISASDVVIDFTVAEATPEFVRLAAAKGKAFVCGTTGLGAEGHEALKQATAKIPVLYAPNTSLSLVAMKRVTELAAKLLGGFDYDVAIVEEHHRMKKDSPSGTAKALEEAVERGNGGKKKPQHAGDRVGGIVGEHEVIFAGQGETIRLHHSVTDRRIFARGAVQAALWLRGKLPGLYTMEDVLGI